MKRNLILSLVLILLIILAYIFEEKKDQKQLEQSGQAESLLIDQKLGNVLEFSTKEAKIIFRNSEFVTAKHNLPVAMDRLNKVFELLANIRGMRKIEPSEIAAVDRKQLFFDERDRFQFVFERGQVSFLLGRKIDFDQSFYLEISQGDKIEVWIAEDVSPVEGVYTDKDYQTTDEKYVRLKTILYFNEDFYVDTRLFRGVIKQEGSCPWRKYKLQNINKRPMVLSFASNQTIPEIFQGMKYKSEEISLFCDQIYQTVAQQIIPNADPHKLKDPLAFAELCEGDNRCLVKLSLFRKYGKNSGYFVKRDPRGEIFQMKQSDLAIFYINHQQFWDLNPHLFTEAASREVPFSLSFAPFKKVFKMKKIPDDKTRISAEDRTLKLKFSAIENLVEILSRSSDMVTSIIDNPKAYRVQANASVRMIFGSRTVWLFSAANGFEMLDESTGTVYHYFISDRVSLKLREKEFIE